MSRCRNLTRRVSIGITPAMEIALAALPKKPLKECWWLHIALSEAIYAYAACYEDGIEEGNKRFRMRLECSDGDRRGLALEQEERKIQTFLDSIKDEA